MKMIVIADSPDHERVNHMIQDIKTRISLKVVNDLYAADLIILPMSQTTFQSETYSRQFRLINWSGKPFLILELDEHTSRNLPPELAALDQKQRLQAWRDSPEVLSELTERIREQATFDEIVHRVPKDQISKAIDTLTGLIKKNTVTKFVDLNQIVARLTQRQQIVIKSEVDEDEYQFPAPITAAPVQLPDWSDDVSIPTSSEPEPSSAPAHLPDWLRDATALPDWFSGSSAPESSEVEDNAELSPELPNWLRQAVPNADLLPPPPPPSIQPAAEPVGETDPTEFLESLARRERPNRDIVESPVESERPNTVIAPRTAPPDDTMTNDDLDILGWMESLAKRQGANLDELTVDANIDVPMPSADTAVTGPGYTPGYNAPSPKTDDQSNRKSSEMQPGMASPSMSAVRPPVPQPSAKPASQAAPPPPLPPGASGDAVFFTAFYPRTIQPMTRYGFFVYAHLQDILAQVEQDVKKFQSDLGGQLPPPKTAKKSANIQPGTPITITIECEDIEFSPPSLTKKWDGDWTRFDFDFKAAESLKGDTIIGSVSVSVYGIEVAQIKFAMEVSDAPAVAESTSPDMQGSLAKIFQRFKRNPLAEAKFAKTDSVGMYHHVFISYSRQDRVVAEAYRLAQLAMGNDVFMDTYSIRSGEDWRVALANAIDSADVFQLFWSEHSASSDNVKDEWEYALNYKCPDSKCASFIRPVYWVAPLVVKPPDELSHLNFRFVPMLGADQAEKPPSA